MKAGINAHRKRILYRIDIVPTGGPGRRPKRRPVNYSILFYFSLLLCYAEFNYPRDGFCNIPRVSCTLHKMCGHPCLGVWVSRVD